MKINLRTRLAELRKHSQAQKQAIPKLQPRSTSLIKANADGESSSHYSTCCSNTHSGHDSPQKSLHNLDDQEDEMAVDPLQGCVSYNDFLTFLPISINGMRVKRITWDMFSAEPNIFSGWKAHCYWTVGYTFDINMRKMKKSNNIRYRLQINVQCFLSERSWVKFKWDRLLEHETGHYLIGCLCALEFKRRADKFKYTKNYRMECTKIFQDTFQQYLQMERRYDEETAHSQNVVKQKEWNLFIKQELLKY